MIAAGCGKDSPTDETTATASAGITTGEAEDSTAGAPTTGGEPPSHEVCDRYIACVGAATPEALPAAQAGFGDGSVCWQGGVEEAQQCIDGCASLLAQYHEMFPDEPQCDECTTDAQCDEVAGEVCVDGGCSACGNGVVDAEEYCDSQPACDADCHGPAECKLLTGMGCNEDAYCQLDRPGLEPLWRTECDQDFDYAIIEVGADCTNRVVNHIRCPDGSQCIPGDQLPAGCPGEQCCAAYCDLTKPDTCLAGHECRFYADVLSEYGEFADEGLDYLGICAKPA